MYANSTVTHQFKHRSNSNKNGCLFGYQTRHEGVQKGIQKNAQCQRGPNGSIRGSVDICSKLLADLLDGLVTEALHKGFYVFALCDIVMPNSRHIILGC